MEKRRNEPLAMGLIGHRSGLVYAQLEVHMQDTDVLDLVVRRKPYANLPDIELSIKEKDLEEIIDVLSEAKKRLDALWLARLAETELTA